MAVFVPDKHKKPLMPCAEKRARLLLQRGRAVVHRMVPFTIRLKGRLREDCALQPVRLTLDPGSRATGMALARKKAGVHVGRVTVRASGSFNIQTPQGVVQGIHARHCRLVQRADGYGYFVQPKPTEIALSSPA